jgi:hypothetical protein
MPKIIVDDNLETFFHLPDAEIWTLTEEGIWELENDGNFGPRQLEKHHILSIERVEDCLKSK